MEFLTDADLPQMIEQVLHEHINNSKEVNAILKDIQEFLSRYSKSHDGQIKRLKVELATLKNEIERIRQENSQIRNNSNHNSNGVEEINSTGTMEISNKQLMKMLRHREEELNRLYNLTESDLKYRVYYVVRDEAPNWVDFTDIYRFVALPASDIRKHLKDFQMRGLIEIKDARARANLVIRPTQSC